VGRRFGKRPFLEKSLEGSLAFFVTAVIVVFVTPKIEGLPMEYVIGIIGAAVGAAAESAPLRLDDNLSVPVSICLIMWLLYELLLPSVNLAVFV
jgi:dolichol kinase